MPPLQQELCDLRREVKLIEHGERIYMTEPAQWMRRWRDALEDLVGADLDATLAAEAVAGADDQLTMIAALLGVGGDDLRKLVRLPDIGLVSCLQRAVPDERQRWWTYRPSRWPSSVVWAGERVLDEMSRPLPEHGGTPGVVARHGRGRATPIGGIENC